MDVRKSKTPLFGRRGCFLLLQGWLKMFRGWG